MISTSEAQELINKKVGHSNIIFNEPYKGDKLDHLFKCKICGHSWKTTPNKLKRADNIGCPKCHVPKKREPKVKEPVVKKGPPGSKKLREGMTRAKPIKRANDDVVRIKAQIVELKSEYKELERQLPIHRRDFEAKAVVLRQVSANDWEFNFFALILLPLWILVSMSQSSKNAPYRRELEESRKECDYLEKRMQWVGGDIRSLNWKIEDIERQEKYRINVERLSDRLTLKLGSKTNLYYFRFKWDGRMYYKIGISVNGVGSRYTRWDGKGSLDIDEIFFDVPVYSAKSMESLILETFDEYRARDPKLLGEYNGWTEVFTRDVLELE
jgi:hypothetical protein